MLAPVYCAIRPLFWERRQVSLGLSLPPNEAVHLRERGIKLCSPGSGVSSCWIMEMMKVQQRAIMPTRHVISELFFGVKNLDHGFVIFVVLNVCVSCVGQH